MREIGRSMRVFGALLLFASAAAAQGAKPLSKCAPDAVVSGTVCIDRYEASVWRVPGAWTENTSLVRKIQQGKVKLAELDAIADQLGTGPGDYGDCTAEGAGCDEIFAVSIAGALPSSDTTWFQAQQACKNSRKRLPTNAEWQAAVAGTPDGADDSSTTCNRISAAVKLPSGQRSACVSFDGAFDMVGNLREWVADWVPLSDTCGDWPSSISSSDDQCLAGASSDVDAEPGALQRGGGFTDGGAAGPFAIDGRHEPSSAAADVGFRCVR